MHRPPPGQYRTIATTGAPFRAFVPAPLPPTPPVEWTPTLRRNFDDALLALGRLDAVAAMLPNAALVHQSFVRKEAVLSSQIEGIQSSLTDLLLYEIDEQPDGPVEDAHEVSCYIAAFEHGLARLREGFPLSLRLICEMHALLLDHPLGRGKAAPGHFRRSQVWIGGTQPSNAVFVPPPPDAVIHCLHDFERFLNDLPEATPPLLKAALAHVQFEIIHPFLDGNGRIGRLLILLQLVNDGVLYEPLVYPSLYSKKHRDLYYDLLNEVRLDGDWERWLDYFATGIEQSATLALKAAQRLLELVSADRDRIMAMGRGAASALAIHQSLQRQPVTKAAALVADTGLALATVKRMLAKLEDAGVVSELMRRRRTRVFIYRPYMDVLNTEL